MTFIPAAGMVLDGRYRLEQKIDEWNLGDVWVATDLRVTSRAVEVRITRDNGGAWDPIASAQFDHECDALARSPRGLIDRGRVQSLAYLVTAFDGPVGMPATREMQSMPQLHAPVAMPPTNAFAQPFAGASPPPVSAQPFAGGAPLPAPSYGQAPAPNYGQPPYGQPPASGGYGQPAPFNPVPGFGSGAAFAPNSRAGVTPAPQASRLVGAVVIGILVVLIGAALAVRAVLSRSHSRGTVATNVANPNGPLAQLDSTRIPVGASPVRGDPSALVTIVEFGDFQCPFCQRAETTLTQLRGRYGNDLRIVWKNNPLAFHTNAQLAAEAALAAGAQGRFWEMHDLLYANREALARTDLDRYAAQLGLDVTRFAHDLDTHVYAAQIMADQALAGTLGARGTPAFFVNGTELSGAQPVERFTATIDAILVRARMIQPPNTVYATMTDASPLAPPTPVAPPRPSSRTLDPSVIYNVPVTSAQPSLGPSNALVTIVEVSDFQCPFCSRVQPTLDEVRRRYGSDVRIVWRNHPLSFHAHAMDAAEAAMEVFTQQGNAGFWRYYSTLWTNQRALERTDLERYAQAQGIDMRRFGDALDRHVHQPAINADATLATTLGAGGTPGFFINGRFLSGAQPIERFATMIDTARTEALAAIASGTPRAQVYDRTVAGGATAAVYLPSAPSPSAPAAPSGGPGTVYRVTPNPRAPSRGSFAAPVVIEHFSDFQCPFCSRVAPTIDTIATTYGSRVRIVWRNYPLPFHPNAMIAAEAAQEVMAQQGNAGFWRYHDTLFANQRSLDRSSLESYASMQGIDMPRFRRALDMHVHEPEIRADMAAANATGASIGTPATFVNGELVSGAVPFATLQTAIDAHLRAP